MPPTLRDARVVLFFFDPQCGHCEAVARMMAGWNWGDTHIIAVPIAEPRFAAAFLADTHLRAEIATDVAALCKLSTFTTPPHALVLDHGRVVATFAFGDFEGDAFERSLRRSGHIR